MGVLLLGWTDNIKVIQVIPMAFSFEIEFEAPGLPYNCWGVFVHTHAVSNFQIAQLLYIIQRKQHWGNFWFIGGEGGFNEIKRRGKKCEGRVRSEGSFEFFQNFIRTMSMAEIRYIGRDWTWANNKVGEGFVEERLDRFFASPD